MDIVINADIVSPPENSTVIPTQGNFYHNILSCLGYPNNAPPVADLLRKYHHLEGEWLVASPIHWQATHNDAMIIASGSQLELSEQDSQCWFEAFKEFVAPENVRLHYHDAQMWLIQSDDKPQITAKPAYFLQHQSMMPELEALDKTLFWQRFITENQMFFSSHSLNKSRTGLYPINGVWLWGGGKLAPKMQTQMISNDHDLLELASLLSTNVNETHALSGAEKNSLVLCADLNQHTHHALQEQLQKNTVSWYWNNLAYQSKPKSWISRLMERI